MKKEKKDKRKVVYVHQAEGMNREQRRAAKKQEMGKLENIMKKITRIMTPTSSNIIIKAALDQKQAFSFKKEDGSIMRLDFVPNRHKYETNGLTTNPVIAQVMVPNGKFPHISEGDFVVLHHNIIFNQAMEIDTDEREQWRLQAIPVDRWIMGKVIDGEIVPFPDNVVGTRVKDFDAGMFIAPETIGAKVMAQKCKLTAVPDGSEFSVGQEVVIKKWADYEVVYIWEGEEKRRVIVWKEDIEMIL